MWVSNSWLFTRSEHDVERVRVAALKLSSGDFDKHTRAVKMANHDFRDLLMASWFTAPRTHQQWEP